MTILLTIIILLAIIIVPYIIGVYTAEHPDNILSAWVLGWFVILMFIGIIAIIAIVIGLCYALVDHILN